VSVSSHDAGDALHASVSDVTVTRSERGGAVVYGVPYSEHSSWAELVDCVRELSPAGSATRVIPTVNARSRAAAEDMVAQLRAAAAEA
jgi:hypothetical protein